jgi:NAD(P)-dependent dehydrogenase (short-subunit alcohol dehydrogenase family)
MRVVAAARRIEKLTPLKKEFGDLILPAALDVRDRVQVESVVAGLPADFSAIDVLVNNAGLSLNLEPAYRVPVEDWETMVDTNIKGLLYCTRLLLPGMVARGCGHVVNIGSVAAMYAYPGGNVYRTLSAPVSTLSKMSMISAGFSACPSLLRNFSLRKMRIRVPTRRRYSASMVSGIPAKTTNRKTPSVSWTGSLSRPNAMTIFVTAEVRTCDMARLYSSCIFPAASRLSNA